MNNINISLHQIINTEYKKPHTHSVLLGVQSRDDRINFQGTAGGTPPDSPYFIASITKMFTTTVLMQLVDEARLDLDAHIREYLPHLNLDVIHIHKRVDYSQQIKVPHLIHQTSGIADYYEGGLVKDLSQGKDRAYNIEAC